LLIFRNQQFDLPPQLGIFAAGLIEKRPPILWRSLQRSMEEVFGSPPKYLPHGQNRSTSDISMSVINDTLILVMLNF
jgi:hypothetical protein